MPRSPVPASPRFESAAELPALVSYVRQRRCILFVGAGLSLAAGLPNWRALMQAVVRHTAQAVRQPGVTKTLNALIKRGKYTDVADECRQLLGPVAFGAVLRELLDKDVPPPATHQAIVRTPYAGIVTTNFDTLLEKAYARWSQRGVPRAPTGAELAQHGTLLLDGAFFILKAHGSIQDASSLVFTAEDYRRITHENPAFSAMLSALLLSHAVLFVGYSLGDPNFRLLLDSQLSSFGGRTPPRYALMEAVDDTERKILRRTVGIEVISFAKGDYAQVGALLSYLAQQARAGQELMPKPNPNPKPKASAVPRGRLMRTRPEEDLVVLRLRARGPMVDAQWCRTTTADLRGDRVSLQQHYSASGSLNWEALREAMPAAESFFAQGNGDGAALHRVGQALGDAIAAFLDHLPKLAAGAAVMLDVAPALAALPWEWCPVAGQPLGLACPVYRSMPELSEASRGRPFVGQPLRALLIADALGEAQGSRRAMPLPDARAEAQAVAEKLRAQGHEVLLLTGAQARYARVRDELAQGRYDLVYFSGFTGEVEHRSLLHLHDGRVNANELVTLLTRRPPALLCVSANHSGWVPAFSLAFDVSNPRSGSFTDFFASLQGERPGLERAAERAGVGAYIGCMGLPSDKGSKALALTLIDELLNGHTAARALCLARRAAWQPGGDVTPLYFSLSGYGDLRLVPKGKTRA